MAGPGIMTDPTGVAVTPTHFVAVCDFCRSVKTFTTARAREQWQAHHPHEDGHDDE